MVTFVIINRIGNEAPNLLNSMYLLRKDFTLHTIGGKVAASDFEHKPIVFIDDLFSDCQSVNQLCPATDIEAIMGLIAQAYDNRWFVLATTNFPLINGILPKIKEVDQVGRIMSRCNEMLTARAGEFALDGGDYREILAQQSQERQANRKNPPSLEFKT